MSSLGGKELKKASDLGEWGIFLMIYGPPGVGKTPLAAQAADSEYGAPVLFIAVEPGMRSISHRTDIDIREIDDYDDFKAVTNDLFKMTTVPWKTVVIDNGSELAKVHLKKVTGGSYPQLQHYGQNTAEMLSVVRNSRDFAARTHTNVIFIAWDTADKDESTGVIKNHVGFTHKLSEGIPGTLDLIGYLEIIKGVRKLTFNANDKNDAKFRRPPTVEALQIPGELFFKELSNMPMVDLLATLKGNKPFPAEKYKRPTS
jgi:hypothetical protein